MIENIISVGIDIGTSTTQLVFSKIRIENTASFTSVPRIKIVDKQVIYRSDIYFTPLISQTEIDGEKVREIVEEEYKKAGIKPSDLSTGAVIITGETARKENASKVLKTLSGLAGDFVVATAGPDLEAIIAGKGAGASVISKNEGKVVANLDIGGGTTNIAVFENGEVIDTCCLDIGGRLIKLQENTQRAKYISPKLRKLAGGMNIDVVEGRALGMMQLEDITNKMTEVLEEVLGLRKPTETLKYMLTGQDLKRNYKIDYVTFSGGVADYIYNDSDENIFRFGDIGIILGKSIGRSSIRKGFQIKQPLETIRATVVGAGSHTMDISGSTINYTKDIFPLKNIPIIKVSESSELQKDGALDGDLREKIKWFYHDGNEQQIAVAIRGVKNPSFKEVSRISKELLKGMEDFQKTAYPLLIVVENDMAKALGQTLYNHLGYKKDVICIDSIGVDNGDYIDIGKPLANGRVVPVVIKTLIFNS